LRSRRRSVTKATTEDTRRALFETVRANLGEPAAEALMAITIPADTDLATRAETTAELGRLTASVERLRAELYRWFLAVTAVVGLVTYLTR
jgi:hypothetical protein